MAEETLGKMQMPCAGDSSLILLTGDSNDMGSAQS